MSTDTGKPVRPKRLKFLAILLLAALGLPIAAFLSISVISSLASTELIDSPGFQGIKPMAKRTTSIIIVHGIGHHCIGYADKLISNLLEELSGSPSETIQQAYVRYVGTLAHRTLKPETVPRPGSNREGYQIDKIEPLRDGNCKRVELPDDVVDKRQLNTGEELESVVLAEDALCSYINASPKKADVQIYCHKIHVNRSVTHDEGENPEYITGFVRRFDKDVSSERRVRIYEVTWSPATRWIKQSLQEVETFNDAMSTHFVNRFLKSEIVNAGVADAVAYLSDSGMLVNYDILQAFCLTFANDKPDGSSFTGYAFSCDRSHLGDSAGSFSKQNDIFLISHSLGTRILFDSIGLMAMGVKGGKKPAASGRAGLVKTMGSTFQRIGAAVPPEPDKVRASASQSDFATLLARRIPEFARAIKSVYVFTNQVPLLAANLSSPFQEGYAIGNGFKAFLELHAAHSGNAAPNRLQVVAFHDPDDFLSYNLSCWYYETILKKLPETRDRLQKEAEFRAIQEKSKVGDERRKLGDTMFGKNCSKRKLANPADISLFDDIWGHESNLLALKDATVRLRGRRVEWIAADPLAVHSNYFSDESIHKWIVNGHSGVDK